MISIFTNMMKLYTELSKHLLEHQKQNSHTIFEIAKFIQNHYHQDIALSGIANHFYLIGLSPNEYRKVNQV